MSITVKNKIFVYDSARGFSRFLKSRLNTHYEIETENKRYKLKKYDIPVYDCVFYIVNTTEDVAAFSKVYPQTSLAFVGVADNELINDFKNFQDITLLDLQLSKNDLFRCINDALTFHIV